MPDGLHYQPVKMGLLRMQDVQKQSKALGRRSRRRAQADDPAATAELRRLYEQQQVTLPWHPLAVNLSKGVIAWGP